MITELKTIEIKILKLVNELEDLSTRVAELIGKQHDPDPLVTPMTDRQAEAVRKEVKRVAAIDAAIIPQYLKELGIEELDQLDATTGEKLYKKLKAHA